jgi:hypothetical protein
MHLPAHSPTTTRKPHLAVPRRSRPVGGEPLWQPARPVPDRGHLAATDRLDPAVWAALTAHEPTRRRYQARVCQRGPGQCWYWLGAISDTGHGKLRAGTRAATGDEPPSRVVTAHVYGWHLINGPISVHPHTSAPVIAHRCDEPSCQNPACWRLDDTAGNTADYLARRSRPGPLTDIRGPAGRARAIAAAIKTALAQDTDVEAVISAAAAAGIPAAQDTLW